MEKFSNSADDLISPSIDLQHPEILSNVQLKQMLIQHNVAEECCLNADKQKLVDLFRKVILPLPQRTHRQNRRGILLARQQKKPMTQECNISPSKLNLENSKLNHATTPTSFSHQSRLKPPPSTIEFKDKKIVQLSSKLQSNCLENGSPKTDSSNACRSVDSSSKIIRLINRTLSNTEKKSGSDASSNHKRSITKESKEESDTPKKKHRPITWP